VNSFTAASYLSKFTYLHFRGCFYGPYIVPELSPVDVSIRQFSSELRPIHDTTRRSRRQQTSLPVPPPGEVDEIDASSLTLAYSVHYVCMYVCMYESICNAPLLQPKQS